eukprot:3946219-Pyramimonas_sp.AAC.1
MSPIEHSKRRALHRASILGDRPPACVSNLSFKGSRYWKKGSRRASGCAEALLGRHEGTAPGMEDMNAPPAHATLGRAGSLKTHRR